MPKHPNYNRRGVVNERHDFVNAKILCVWRHIQPNVLLFPSVYFVDHEIVVRFVEPCQRN